MPTFKYQYQENGRVKQITFVSSFMKWYTQRENVI